MIIYESMDQPLFVPKLGFGENHREPSPEAITLFSIGLWKKPGALSGRSGRSVWSMAMMRKMVSIWIGMSLF